MASNLSGADPKIKEILEDDKTGKSYLPRTISISFLLVLPCILRNL